MKGRHVLLIPIVLAVLCLAAIGVRRALRVPGAVAELRQNGAVIGAVPLDEDTSFTVYAPGGGSNTVTVSGGRVRVSHASCPDQLCVRQGWVSDGGVPIVCLPNGLVILIKGGEESLDAAVG